jgi:hypothetical protein
LQAWRSSGIAVDRLYIKLLTNLDADETLRQQCLVAVEDLRKAHHKLMQGLKRKKKQREVFQEQLDFGIALTKMYSTIQQIK